jgi:nitrogen-specific signal transduction histidine kinase
VGTPPPPYEPLRGRLLALAGGLEPDQPSVAAELRREVEAWWPEQQAWLARIREVLAVHHEINNALVGIRGNAQLIQRGAAGRQPGVSERLEVVIRESQRIQEAVGRLRDAKAALLGPGPASRAA